MSEGRPLDIYQEFSPDDKARLQTAQLSLLDMIRTKIEEGKVESLALLMVSKDPSVDGGKAYTGSRFIVRATHLDLLEDVYLETMEKLSKQYGITPEELRRDRNRPR
jgi:hypothetical protein